MGCAFAICLEKKQAREKEKVTVTFSENGTSFTRMGSFRQTTLTERLADPQSAIVAGLSFPFVFLPLLRIFNNVILFYSARNARIASAVLATAFPSVRPSVCLSIRPSHAGIVSKRRHVARCSLHCWIAKCV